MRCLYRILRFISQRRETNWRFTLVVGVAFALVQLFGHLHHEMWRDELHCWAVGRKASGLWDLLTGERRYDGHPFLWYYLLHLVSQLTRSYVALQFVGATLSVTAAVLWLRHAPLPRAFRVLLVGSYYLVYEYGVMNRSYSLGVVLLFAFCAAYRRYRPRYLLLSGILALLSATSLYGTILALTLGLFLFSARPVVQRQGDGPQRLVDGVPVQWLAGLAVLGLGMVVTVLTTMPPADAVYAPGPVREVTTPVVMNLLAQYWRGMFPFRDLAGWNWAGNDALFSQTPRGQAAMPWLAATWFVLTVAAFRRSPRLAATYALGAVTMAAAQHAIYPGGWRHLGHYFVLFIVCLWLYENQPRARAPTLLLHGLFLVISAVQVFTAIAALETDYRQEFSGSVAAARFLRDHHFQNRPVVGDPDDAISPLAVMLDRPFLFPVTGETADVTVSRWGSNPPTQMKLLQDAQGLAHATNGSALLVLNYDLAPDSNMPGLTTTLIYRGGPAIIDDESYRIYEVKQR